MTASLDVALLAEGLKAEAPSVPLRSSQRQRLERARQRQRKLLRYTELRMEAMQLLRPLPHCEAFHACTAKWRLGDGANRSSKTLCGAFESCRAWLGCDPYNKYVKHGGNSLVIGLDGDHISQMWAKCAEPGLFKLIRDEHSPLWRSVRPNPDNPKELDPYDEAYREKWRDAPPLIPPRMIRRIAWEERGKGVPRRVLFTTGWKVLFRSSEGKSPRGEHYHHGWIDEQISNENFYIELSRGLVALDEMPHQRPKGIWTATAQTTNLQLLELREAAAQGSNYVRAFLMLIDDNPYIPLDEKQAFHDSLSEDERQTRYFGKHAILVQRVYPTYDPQGLHGCEPREIPPDWTRYVILDPGTQHCGTLFGAIDPDEAHAWVYDGFDLRQAEAQEWAVEVAKRERDHRFELAIVDQQMGKEHWPGASKNVAQQYFAALVDAGVEPRVRGPERLGGFFPGSNDVEARQEALRSWMAIRGSGPFAGTPMLRVMKGCVPKLDKQIRFAHMDSRRQGKRTKSLDFDLLDTLEYWAGFRPYYHEPELIKRPEENSVYQRFKEKQRKARVRQMQEHAAGVELGYP